LRVAQRLPGDDLFATFLSCVELGTNDFERLEHLGQLLGLMAQFGNEPGNVTPAPAADRRKQ
jgi:hypothetical protein